MKKLLASIAAAATIFTAPSCSSVYQAVETQQQISRESALEDILRSVVCLRNTAMYVNQNNGERTTRSTFGTGFVYKREDGWSYLTTSEHVGKQAEREIVQDFFNSGNPEIWNKVSEEVTIVDNKFDKNKKDDILLSVVRSDTELDTIVLKTRTPLHIAHSYRIGTIQEHPGDPVYVVGFPLGFAKAVTEGTISNPSVKLEGQEYTMIDINTQPGHSGGPVFVRGTDNELYLIGQMRLCMPYAFGIGGGFGLATEISELQSVWRIGQEEPLPIPDWFWSPPTDEKKKL